MNLKEFGEAAIEPRPSENSYYQYN